MAAKKEKSIKEGFDELETILKDIEKDGVSLEESFDLYNKGVMLIKELNGKLVEAKERLQIVNDDADDFDDEP